MARTTRRRSAPRSSRGTAAGSRYSMTTPCAGAAGDTSPAAVAARPAKMLTSAPLSAAPHDVFSSDLHASFISVSARMEMIWLSVPQPKEINHIPRAECGGGEEEGPVAPVVAGRDDRRGGGCSRRPEGMTARARGGRGEGDALVVMVGDASARPQEEPGRAEEEATARRRRR